MQLFSDRSSRVLGALAVATALLLSHINPITAIAATGAPNIGDFVPDTLRCGKAVDAKDTLQFTGQLRAGKVVVARLATDPGWPQLPESSVTVMVDGVRQALHNNEFQFGDLNRPSTILVQVNELPAGQPVHIELRQTPGLAREHLATGWSNEKDCSFTTNPSPA